MEQAAKKEGMSRGCMIGLIVAGVLLVVVVALVVTCYMKRDQIMQFGMRTMLRGAKEEINKGQFGMDSVQVNQFFDNFAARLDSTKLDDPSTQAFFNQVANIANDGKVDSAEVKTLLEAMVTLYPDMRAQLPQREMPMMDTTMMHDSTMMMDGMMHDSSMMESTDSAGE